MDLLKYAPLRINDIRSKYKVIDKVGKGTYGIVFKVLNLQDNKYYAIKKFQNTEAKLQVQGFPITALREISLLKQLNHPNVINLKQIICSKPNKRNLFRGSTFMVFEYMHHDFSGLFRSKIKFSLPEIKCIMKQLLQGCNFLHQNKIMHRDIKSANILLNDQGIVQIADFGLGRRTRFDNVYTYKVVTLWYRAPQLLLGCKSYNHKVDVWSIGCVFAEFLIGQVLFKKQTQYALIQKIYQICGDLDQNQYVQQYLRGCVYYHDMKPKKPSKNILESYIKKLNPQVDQLTLKFLKGLLELNPYKRFSCEEALDHQFFKQNPQPCLPQQIHKLDVQYHQMFRDRSLKIQRKKDARKQSLDWSEEQQRKNKQRNVQKTQDYSDLKQINRYQKIPYERPYERKQQYERYQERKYQNYKKQYDPYEKYPQSKKRKQSRSQKSSSSSQSSHSRSRNKRYERKRDSSEQKYKPRNYHSNKYHYQRDYQNERSSQKKYDIKPYNQDRKKDKIQIYETKNDSSKKLYQQPKHSYHRQKQIYDYREKQRKQYSSRYEKEPRFERSQNSYRPSQKYNRQSNDNHYKYQGKQKHYGQSKSNYRAQIKYQNGEYRQKRQNYQKYDKVYQSRDNKQYKKEPYNYSQRYYQERRAYSKQPHKQYRDKDYQRKEYDRRQSSNPRITIQTKKSTERRKDTPERRRNSNQRRRSPNQRRRYSPAKKYMEVQQY